MANIMTASTHVRAKTWQAKRYLQQTGLTKGVELRIAYEPERKAARITLYGRKVLAMRVHLEPLGFKITCQTNRQSKATVFINRNGAVL